jgi:hypothetical protein
MKVELLTKLIDIPMQEKNQLLSVSYADTTCLIFKSKAAG